MIVNPAKLHILDYLSMGMIPEDYSIHDIESYLNTKYPSSNWADVSDILNKMGDGSEEMIDKMECDEINVLMQLFKRYFMFF